MMRRLNGDWRPVTPQDAEVLGKYKAGDIVGFKKTRKNRNAKQHALFFCLLTMVWENQELYKSVEHLRKDLMLKTGYVDTHLNYFKHPETGKWTERVLKYPKSMSYASMDKDEFEVLFDKVTTKILEMFLPHMTKAGLEEELLSYYSNWNG